MTNTPPASVLAATDFTEAGDAAVALAYAAVAPGGTVHLLHFIEPQIGVGPAGGGEKPPTAAERRAAERLRALAPAHAQAKGVRTEPHVIDGPDDPGTLLERECKRVGAQAVFLGSHGKKGWKGVVMGSVANAALKKCSCPVVLVRPSPKG